MSGDDTDGLAARRAALALIEAVGRGATMDTALAALPSLEPRDRAFAHRLAAGFLRRQGTARALIDGLLDHPLPHAARGVRDILALGAVQALFLGTPPHAAVDTTVRLVEEAGHPRLKSLANAVLRRLLREAETRLHALDTLRLDTADWLWDRLVAAYGEAMTRAIVAAQSEEAPLDLTARADIGGEALARALEGTGARLLPTGSVRLPAGTAAGELAPIADGTAWVQDAAAALPVRLLGPVAGLRVLDLCAAPGGKTLQLAAAGARVTALDRSAPRLERLAGHLARTGLSAEIIVADATAWQAPSPFDAVLIDAPCSATGTVRRHPELPWRRGAGDLAALTALQDRLLARITDLVRPGGLAVFCTCSLLPEEGEQRVERALAATSRLRHEPVDAAAIPTPFRTADGALRTLPHLWAAEGGIDGFYAARLRVS